MEQSLLAAVTGIEANQTYMDVIGNNVANANTIGYKSEDPIFTDLLAEQIAGASAPLPAGQGAGVNPVAIGAGVRVAAVSSDLSQGAIEQTGQPTDVAIQGSGYFVAVQNGTQVYTRVGHFLPDANGDLATATGGVIEGWQANGLGAINTNSPIGPISVPSGEVMTAQATTQLTLGGNLPAWDGSGAQPSITTTINGYDSLGATVPVTLTFTGVAGQANTWTVQGSAPDPAGGTTSLWNSPPTVTFDPSTGQITSISGATQNPDGSYSLPVGNMPAGYSFPAGDTWNIDFPAPGSSGAVTQYDGAQTFAAAGQDGHTTGTLQSFSIGADGTIIGSFSNGESQPIAQLALATFANPGGLSDLGNSTYAASANSGQATIAPPGTGGRGTLVGGALEGSNVDLATELTNLIVAQEAYQANTKVVSATSTNLNSLMQMG